MLLPFSIFIQVILFNRIARLSVFISSLLSIARSLTAYFYPDLFPLSDMPRYWNDILYACAGYTNIFLFNYKSLGTFFGCNFLKSIRDINLIYTIIGCVFVSLILRLRYCIENQANAPDQNNDEAILPIRKSLNLVTLLFIFDPCNLLFTTVLGKDVFQFGFMCSLIYLLLKPNKYSIFIFIPTLLICFYSRGYTFIFLSAALLFSLFSPNLFLNIKFPFLHLKNFSNKLNIKLFFVSVIVTPLLFYLISYVLKNLTGGLDYEVIKSFYDGMNQQWAGSLTFPIGTPFPIKYLFFWILPMGIIQNATAGYVYSYSTILVLILIFNILKNTLIINNIKLKIMFYSIIMYSLGWTSIAFNSGISTRHRFTVIVPILLIFEAISRSNQKKMKSITSINIIK